jgi:hypothetical protein
MRPTDTPVEADQEGRGAKAEQQPGLCHLLRPGAEIGEQACEAERAEAPRTEETERLSEGGHHPFNARTGVNAPRPLRKPLKNRRFLFSPGGWSGLFHSPRRDDRAKIHCFAMIRSNWGRIPGAY